MRPERSYRQCPVRCPERRALAEHLRRLSKVVYLVEWNMSGDTDDMDGEAQMIRDLLRPGAVLAVAIAEANQAAANLSAELVRAAREGGK